VLREEPSLLAVAGEEIAGELVHVLVAGAGGHLHPHGRELEQDGADGRAPLRQPYRAVGPESYRTLEVHVPLRSTLENYVSLHQRLTQSSIRQLARHDLPITCTIGVLS